MNVNYKWKINTLFVIPQQDDKQDIVAKVSWDLTGTVDDAEYGLNGIEELLFNNDQFIPFENLMENQVIGWIQNSLGQEKIENLKLTIFNQLKSKILQPIEVVYKPAPWIKE